VSTREKIGFAVRIVAKFSIGKPVYPGLAGGNDFSQFALLHHMGEAGFNLVNSTVEHFSGSCRQAAAASGAFIRETLSMADAVALYDEADRLKDAGKLEEAVAKLNEALAADSNYSLAHSALAVILQKLGRHEEAINHARRVCELSPEDPFSFTALSVIYQRAFAGTQEQHYIRMAEDAMEQSRMLQGRH
jgi:Flp pilus assembly protein TadD